MLIPGGSSTASSITLSRSGAAKGGTRVTFGEYGIQALEPAYITNRQIESAAYRDHPPHPSWRQGLDQHLPGPPADEEAC